MWLIERVSQEDETVHLWKMEVETRRKFSVPGALTATIESGKLRGYWFSLQQAGCGNLTPKRVLGDDFLSIC